MIVQVKRWYESNRRGYSAISNHVTAQFDAALRGNQIAQATLASGAMQLYVDVDIVEGLDVDKEKFDWPNGILHFPQKKKEEL